jgi:hypothetical protein
MSKYDHFEIRNMSDKCNDRYIFQTNRKPTWIPDLIFKYQNAIHTLGVFYCKCPIRSRTV